MGTVITLPSRYYRIYPSGAPEGHEFENLRLPVEETALLLVDVHGAVKFGEEHPMYEAGMRSFHRIGLALDAARAIGMAVVYVANHWYNWGWDQSEFGKMTHRSQTGDRGTLEQIWGAESDTIEFSDVVAPRDGEPIVRKQMYDGFFETPLDSVLRFSGIKNLLCAGYGAHVCLLHTMIGAMNRNYRTILLRDCTIGGAIGEDGEAMSMTQFAIRYVEIMVGYTTTSDVLIDACNRI
jgi:nicotinamidase-related amidase